MKAEQVAKVFAEKIRGELADADFDSMMRLNATDEYKGNCASHNYCASNILMAESISEVIGECDQAVFTWGNAWEFAKTTYLTKHSRVIEMKDATHIKCIHASKMTGGSISDVLFLKAGTILSIETEEVCIYDSMEDYESGNVTQSFFM